ncbi:MAG: type V CRISPR-associated protein Cas12b [bacterium]
MAAAERSSVKLTQRAYTLRLRGVPGDNEWKERLWRTHEAVNKGAKVFGDWLLTLRGGLIHELANEKIPAKGEKPERAPTEKEIRDRRVILALSWLSVESERGAPAEFIVATGKDDAGTRKTNLENALREILKKRGVKDDEMCNWIKDCLPTLSAEIRDDAVWVDRSKAFDDAKNNDSLDQKDIWDFLSPFFSIQESYLKPIKEKNEENDEDESEGSEEKEKDLVQKAGQWLSNRFGTGKGADFPKMREVYVAIASWASNATPNQSGVNSIATLAQALSYFNPASGDLQGILGLISGPGYKSATRNQLQKINVNNPVSQGDLDALKRNADDDAEKCSSKTGAKGKRDYAEKVLMAVQNVCRFTYLQNGGPSRHAEFAVMLDHAARRVSLAHTWIKRAEAERRKFESDSQKINNVPQQGRSWLDNFREKRGIREGASDEYVIRKRAIGGWKEVVEAWSKSDCKTEEDRIAAARSLQDAGEIEKFGDIQLFEALAGDDAKCVWLINNRPDPQPLIDYAAATEAKAKQQRFKVPAYRHPDPLLHPVFCDFGNSRWKVKFKAHEINAPSNSQKKKKSDDDRINTVTMTLYDGKNITDTKMLWMSKLLIKDLGIMQKPDHDNDDIKYVSRNSRLGRAAGDVKDRQNVIVMNVFEEDVWNARLQAPRGQLETIAKYLSKNDGKWDANAEKMKNGIKWLITFSPRLKPSGPWMEYAKTHNLNILPKYYKHPDNDSNRKGTARHIFSRLPGLRVLSVDLGHRYAAACAVWETLSREKFREECDNAKKNGAEVVARGLYTLILQPEKESNAATKKAREERRGKKFKPAAIYRRIGPDVLPEPDNTPHPAPWARLDRQFLIKLQGEDENPRKASPAELNYVSELEKEIRRKPPEKKIQRVDELMSHAVDIARLGLKRHSDFSRIAFNMITDEKQLPGGRQETLTPEKRIELLTDMLVLWYSLIKNKRWDCPKASDLWAKHIEPLLFGVTMPGELDEDEILTSQAWKKRRGELETALKPAAERLADDENKRREISEIWRTFWSDEDKKWNARLRKLRDWILPRGIYGYEERKNGRRKRVLKDKEKLGAARHVGGLSLTRIATFKSLYQLQKTFHTRLTPVGRQKKEDKNGNPTDEFLTAGEGFGQRILDDLEQMRENRVKQLASRIAEAALGVGRIKINRKKRTGEEKPPKDPERPRERTDAPCHAVVIENLEHYHPEETRTRRENRQLMSWSSSKVFRYLSEACELHGLHLRQVPAGYTSRQDSRTGAPGMRCTDVPLKDFIADAGFWHKEITRAHKRVEKEKEKADPRDNFLIEMHKYWTKNYDEKNKNHKQKSVRIPQRGGEIFVSADGNSPAAKGLQADLNAAANIGLRALLDPDWPAKWWYVPCDTKTFKPRKDKVGGCHAIDPEKPLLSEGKKKSDGEKEKIVNLWRDVSVAPIEQGNWLRHHDYNEDVLKRVIENLKKRQEDKNRAAGDIPSGNE